MAKRDNAGREERSRALWGTTRRDGDSKGSALWGNGGRGGAVLLALLTALMMIPLAAGASGADSSGTSGSGNQGSNASDVKVSIPNDLLAQAQANPGSTFRVIVQGDSNKDADRVADDVAKISAQSDPKLADAAKKADDAVKRALDDYKRLSEEAAKRQADADKAAADAAAKAAKAAQTGRKGDKDAATKAAADAAKKAADAALAAQAAAKARAAAGIADNTADKAHDNVSDAANTILDQQITDQFDSISGVAAGLTGQQITGLASHGSNLVGITPDVPVAPMGPAPPVDPGKWSSSQQWVHAIDADAAWGPFKDPKGQGSVPTIAIVDSGIDNRADFGNRLLASVNLTTAPNNSPGDGRGHGTFVASVAAGSAEKYTGVAPAAKLVSLDVLNDDGMGMTSDVIRAAQWILDNKSTYNIRVANFSLNSAIQAPFYLDPLDQAVEQLWFNGIVVVTAAGNSGTGSTPSGVRNSPSNDPFVITVGAADIGSKPDTKDDSVAPWSSWGTTAEGFMKPEILAPGRYIIGAVSRGASLKSDRPDATKPGDYMQLSGTSFAAPIVAGAAAEIIARHPAFTPDQVKGALMLTAQAYAKSIGFAGGVGGVNVNKALGENNPPNPNAGLNAFVGRGPGGQGGFVFNAASWNNAAQSNASWNSASWNSASWNSASWNSASWNSASWNSASWNSASWNSASWNSASWNSASWNSASWNSSSREDALDRDDPGR